MNIIHCIPKTAGRLKGFSSSAGSDFLLRTFPAFMVIVVCFVLASGWGIGVDKAYAGTVEVWVSADEDDAEEAASGSIDLTSSDLENCGHAFSKYQHRAGRHHQQRLHSICLR
jgi:hypothetical protein